MEATHSHASPSRSRRRRAQPGDLARPQALRLAARADRSARARSSPGPTVQLTGCGGFWFFGPLLVFGVFPLLDIVVGMDPSNPPDSVIKWLEQDRYYRWCTYVFIPIQYAGLVFACWLWSSGDLSIARQPRPGADDGRRRRHRDQHRPRARPQARQPRALAEPRRPRPDRLRPLLHRAQPRPPRPRRHPRGPGQLAAGGELLGLPAAHRRRQPALAPGGSSAPASTAWASRTGRSATTSSAPGR